MPIPTNMHVHNVESRTKRRRTDDDDGVATSQANADGTAYIGPVERDPVYWDEDEGATLYVRVFGILFKINPVLFDCSIILKSNVEAKMRQNGRTGTDGPRLTEERPYHLMNCTVGQFRAFLWISAIGVRGDVENLGAFPMEHESIEKLMRISDFLAIYSAEKLKDWVESKFTDMASGTHPFLDSCSSISLSLLLSIGCNGRDDFKQAVVAKWIQRLWNKSAPSVPAIDAAEQHSIDSLRGVAYYIYAQDMIDRQEFTERGALKLRADTKLSKEQAMRVYGGFCSLVASWERFRSKPVPLAMADGCAHAPHAKCASVWEKRWLSAIGWRRIMNLNTADFLALQDCLRDQLMNDEDLKEALHPACRLRGLEDMKKIRARTQDHLAEHFTLN